MMAKKILILAGDGVGPEIVKQAEKIIQYFIREQRVNIDLCYGSIGGQAIDEVGVPLPDDTLLKAQQVDAILLGAVGGQKWDNIERHLRPERGLLAIRSKLNLFANLRPVLVYPQLVHASTLKTEVVSGLDFMIVRELTSGIYFGEPRGISVLKNGERQGLNSLVYTEHEIERIVRVAFEIAQNRNQQLCSVDKANVLEATELWRMIVDQVALEYPDCTHRHLYVDNAAMQLVREPKQFDVIVTTNMFGDILSDLAAMLTGSIGMLPSASLNDKGYGMYEPIHGSAPDIAKQDVANPLATILSLAMLFRYSLAEPQLAIQIEQAVQQVLIDGFRSKDLLTFANKSDHLTQLGTEAMGDQVVKALARQN